MFKRLIEGIRQMLKERSVEIDTAQFGDPVADKTDWGPLKRGGANFCTHKLVRTDWTDRAFGTRRFWAEIIGLSLDAGDWLVEKKIKALATDFYTDPPPVRECETCGKFVKRERSDIRNHHKLLGNGILLIDFVTNLKALTKNRVILICLPIKLKGTDGGPARVIAIE